MFKPFTLPVQPPPAYLTLLVLILTYGSGFAQLIVNDSNVSQQKEKKYIQFMYYIEKGSQKPVYFIDHGITEVDVRATQKIKVDNIEISGDMSPMLVLNLLYKNGWEYMGDMHYQREPMADNWFIYTLERRRTKENH
jgi:hypothetical protein